MRAGNGATTRPPVLPSPLLSPSLLHFPHPRLPLLPPYFPTTFLTCLTHAISPFRPPHTLVCLPCPSYASSWPRPSISYAFPSCPTPPLRPSFSASPSHPHTHHHARPLFTHICSRFPSSSLFSIPPPRASCTAAEHDSLEHLASHHPQSPRRGPPVKQRRWMRKPSRPTRSGSTCIRPKVSCLLV